MIEIILRRGRFILGEWRNESVARGIQETIHMLRDWERNPERRANLEITIRKIDKCGPAEDNKFEQSTITSLQEKS